MAFRVINNHRQPITLDGGIILAAAGTPGSTREVESITDKDRRRNAGRITVIEIAPQEAEAVSPTVVEVKTPDVSAQVVTTSEPAAAEVKSSRQPRRSE